MIFKNNIFNSDKNKNTEEIFNNYYDTNPEIKSSSEQLLDYEVRTERYFILVINNEKEGLNLEIEYNRYSNALHIDENKTIQLYVRANEEFLFKDSEFSKEPGCIENDCTVNIISSKTI